MTRKDYEAIAAAIKAALHDDAASEYNGADIAARHIADALASDNPRFDRARFLKACGL